MKKTSFSSYQIFVLIISAGIMLLSIFVATERIFPDTVGYINMDLRRSAVYPLFIALFRLLFAEHYLLPMLIVQNLLFSLATWVFSAFLQTRFRLSNLVFTVLQTGILAPSFCTVLFSSNPYTYPSTVLTEGITISLFYFSLRYLLDAALSRQIKPLIPALPFIVTAMLTRTQMGYLFILWALIFLYVRAPQKRSLRNLAALAAVTAGVLIFSGLFTRFYHLAVSGRFVGTQFALSSILTKMLYLSDREDAALFAGDPEAFELFSRVYADIEEQQLTHSFAAGGFFERHRHYANHYDKILYGNLHATKDAVVSETGYSGVDGIIYGESLCGRMILPLLFDNLWRYTAVSFRAFIDGLLQSVFVPPIKYIHSVIAGWLLFIVLFSWVFIRNKKSAECRFAVFYIVVLLGNLAPNTLTHYLINRYTVYTLALHYAVSLLLFCGLFSDRLPFLTVRPENRGFIPKTKRGR